MQTIRQNQPRVRSIANRAIGLIGLYFDEDPGGADASMPRRANLSFPLGRYGNMGRQYPVRQAPVKQYNVFYLRDLIIAGQAQPGLLSATACR